MRPNASAQDLLPAEAQALQIAVEAVQPGDQTAALRCLKHEGWVRLEALYWNASHPLRGMARLSFEACQALSLRLWQKLGAGTIEPMSVYRESLNTSNSVDSMLRILGRIYAACNLAYAPTPHGFWRTVYAITGYIYAQCRDGREDQYASKKNLCLQLWLMAWLNPYSLIAGRLPIAIRLVGLLSKSCSYSLSPPTHAGTGLAAADLAEDRAPLPFSRLPLDWSPSLPLYVNAQSAAYAIETLQASAASVKTGDVYESLLGAGQAAGLTPQEVRDFIKRALREFGQAQTRAIPRLPTQGEVTATVGILEVWNAVQEHFASGINAKTRPSTHVQAEVINHSTGGFLLRFKPQEPLLRAGTLIAIRGTAAEPWTLCAIRWLQDNTTEVLTGVEVLSNFPNAIIGQDQGGQLQTPALLCDHEQQRAIYLNLGFADPQNVTQLLVGRELWVLSSVQEMGDDWEYRLVLDMIN